MFVFVAVFAKATTRTAVVASVPVPTVIEETYLPVAVVTVAPVKVPAF